jgi:hypothetical protein
MPINNLRDVAYLSGNPAKTGIPYLPNPTLESWQAEFIDYNATSAGSGTVAAVGKLVRLQAVATTATTGNPGGAVFIQSSTSSEPLATRQYGIVIQAAGVPTTTNGDLNQAKGVMVQAGVIQALCTTTSTAISVDSPLGSDGAGNLTVLTGTPAAGAVLARSLGTLTTSTSTPTLLYVNVGGY